jgi:hypothetical protein
MTYKQNPNSGALFNNSRKTQNTHPDNQGKIYLDASTLEKLLQDTKESGLACLYINAWQKTSQAGEPYFTLYASLKQPKKD